jgi:calcineurin-like phosphoesterase family protein/2'-5' RNA ligase
MNHYLIEFRFFGKSKTEIRKLIWDVNKRYHIRSRHRPVPHISLVGSFNTTDERRLVNDFKNICKKQGLIHFNVAGFDTFENNRVIFLDIQPDKKMEMFRRELSTTLQPYCRMKPYDLEEKFSFHTTITMKLNPAKFEQVKKYISKKTKSNYKHVLLRATLIKNQIILCEYDFLLKKLLNRREAKNRTILSYTFDELKKYLDEKHNHTFNDFSPEKTDKVTVEIDLDAVKKSYFSRIKNLFGKRNVFLISDTHFDHTNIIRYCNRPFKSTSEMNHVIISNWNKTIRKKDIVFFLGDLRFGRGSRETDYWLKRLNGRIYFLNGNHETKSRITKFYDKFIIKYRSRRFLLLHDPKNIPKDWAGWTICGHHHNNYPIDFPFINGKTRLINVGVELLNYTPLNIKKLFDLDYENIEVMESINSIPLMKK